VFAQKSGEYRTVETGCGITLKAMKNTRRLARRAVSVFGLVPALFLGACLFGGGDDDPVNQGVSPGLYRLDLTPLFAAEGVPYDSGVVIELLLEPGGDFRFFLSDTFYGFNIPVLMYSGRWNGTAGALIQSPRLYATAFPDLFNAPGFFLTQPVPSDSGPVRAVGAQGFQRYEQSIFTGGNGWASYRRRTPPPAMSGNFVFRDTFFVDDVPYLWREELTLNAGGGFRLRQFEEGFPVMEYAADSWFMSGGYLVLAIPRARGFSNAGQPLGWDTLQGDWVHSLRAGAGDGVQMWYPFDWWEGVWLDFRREALLKPAAEAAPAGAIRTRPPSYARAAPLWSRSEAPGAAAPAIRSAVPGRTDPRSIPAGAPRLWEPLLRR
jgi:hypothetical protein